MSMNPRVWAVVAPLLGAVACANVWGFDDLTLAQDGGPPDATTPGDEQILPSEGGGGGDAEADALDERDSGGDAADARIHGDAGEDGSRISDTGARDARDDGAAAACKALCSTCCDSTNHCVPEGTGSCGIGGGTCVDCVDAMPCATLSTSCCGPMTGQCGCAGLGLFCPVQ